MAQIGMFPLTDEEKIELGKELAEKVKAYNQAEVDKDQTAREFNEKIKRLRGEMTRLSTILEEERVEREATDAEAPWQSSIEEAERIINKTRRGRQRRDRTGEVIETPEDEMIDGGEARE